jgi:hypothetical protein
MHIKHFRRARGCGLEGDGGWGNKLITLAGKTTDLIMRNCATERGERERDIFN